VNPTGGADTWNGRRRKRERKTFSKSGQARDMIEYWDQKAGAIFRSHVTTDCVSVVVLFAQRELKSSGNLERIIGIQRSGSKTVTLVPVTQV
jgi:hypothetical protein